MGFIREVGSHSYGYEKSYDRLLAAGGTRMWTAWFCLNQKTLEPETLMVQLLVQSQRPENPRRPLR
jgi:hypothetical protein